MVFELRTTRDHGRRVVFLVYRAGLEVVEGADGAHWRSYPLVLCRFPGGAFWPGCKRPASVADPEVPHVEHRNSTRYGCWYRAIIAHGSGSPPANHRGRPGPLRRILQ